MKIISKINSRDYEITISGQGGVKGLDSDGNIITPTIKNWILTVPGSIDFNPVDGYKIYSFGYTVKHKKFPSNSKSGTIKIICRGTVAWSTSHDQISSPQKFKSLQAPGHQSYEPFPGL